MTEQELELFVNDYRIFAKLISPTANTISLTTLVFLHEGLGSIGHWKDFPAELCEKVGCRGFLYDRIGYGKSDAPRQPRGMDYLHKEAEAMLPEVLAKAELEDVILIGHSDGGTIALLYASKYPQKVKGVITEAAHVFVEDITLKGIEESLAVFREDQELKDKFVKYQGEHGEQILHDWRNIWLSYDFRNWNIENILPDIRCPILVIQGEDDDYGSVAQVEAIASQVSGPSEKLLIPDCGHRPHHQAREVVLREMNRFIKKYL
jgi:pimeloyl-ACP methyl ester carboxylesterase